MGILSALFLVTVAQVASLGVAGHLEDLAAAEPGFAFLEDGRREEALHLFAERLRIDPVSVAAHVGRVRATVVPADRAALREELERRAAASDAPPAILTALLDLVPDHPDADRLRERRDALDPDDPFAALDLAARRYGPRVKSFHMRVDGGWSVSIPMRPAGAPAGAAREVLGSWLVAERGSLLLWHQYLTDFSSGGTEDLAAARAAVDAQRDAPFAPRVLLDALLWEADGETRFQALEKVEQDYPDGPFWDDVRLERANLLHFGSHRARALELLEGIVERERGDQLRSANFSLARLYLEVDRPAEALRRVEWSEARGVPLPECAVRALLALGRFDEAETRARSWVEASHAAAAAGDVSQSQTLEARWLLGEVLHARGRAREALRLFDEVAADPERPAWGPWARPGSRWKQYRLLADAFPFPLAALGLHILILALSFCVAGIVVASRWRRVRRFLAPTLALAGVLLALQVASGWANPGVGAGDVFYLGLAAIHNFLLAAAGAVLLPAVGAKHGPWFRPAPPPAAVPRARLGVARAIFLVAAVVFGMAAWTVVLMPLAEPKVGPFFERMSTLFRGSEYSILMGGGEGRLGMLLLAVIAAMREELVFRFVLLGVFVAVLRRTFEHGLFGLAPMDFPRAGRAAAAVAVPAIALAWAVLHAGMVEPEWYKMAQVGGLGILLGALALRQGAGSALVAHVTFNATLVALAG